MNRKSRNGKGIRHMDYRGGDPRDPAHAPFDAFIPQQRKEMPVWPVYVVGAALFGLATTLVVKAITAPGTLSVAK